jgi:3-methyladenine DNA glycosylase Tag
MAPKGLTTGADGITRCSWAGEHADYLAYHDEEWGRPVSDDRRLFEKICLEGFQSGLSWLTILRKRENFRRAFRDFEFEAVARFNRRSVERLLLDAGIVRHRGKIESVLKNARRARDLVEELGSGGLGKAYLATRGEERFALKVVHRDIKPENVLITPDHEVKIMDLGVARLMGETIRLSVSGMFAGTILYTSPDHLKGEGEVLDGRADLFSLGVILHELASGVHPHPGDGFAAVLASLVEGKPRRLGERNPRLSAFFEEVVHVLLAKDREDRFASSAELFEVLEQGEQSDWWGNRGEDAVRHLDAALDHLVSGYSNEQAVALADRVLEMDGLLTASSRAEVLLKKAARLGLLGRRKLEEAVALAEKEGEPGLRSRVHRAFGTCRLNLSRYETAQKEFLIARGLAIETGDREMEGSATEALGLVFYSLGQPEEAREHIEHSLAIATGIGNRLSAGIALVNLGPLHARLGALDTANVQLDEAHRLLCHMRNHAPEEYRETMIENVRLHLDIMAASEEHRAP